MQKKLTVIQENSREESPLPPLGNARVAEVANLFAALADPTRLAIVSMLAESSEVCVCDITSSFSLGQPTISHHLRILRDAGLIVGDKRGKWVYYSLVRKKAEEVREVLAGVL